MQKLILIGAAVIATAATAQPAFAQYYGSYTSPSTTGALIGASTGALIAGPPGAAVGVMVGAAVGVPRLTRRNQECWYDRAGMRHCRSY
jgi:uncharacterized protein YqgC (DUF456 family)